jgi:hypothetical protein
VPGIDVGIINASSKSGQGSLRAARLHDHLLRIKRGAAVPDRPPTCGARRYGSPEIDRSDSSREFVTRDP